MATWIKTDGTLETVKPINGKRFSLAELQKFVGGYIQLVKTKKPVKYMYVNEEGTLENLPVNYKATDLIDSRFWVLPPGIRGNVIVCEKGEG